MEELEIKAEMEESKDMQSIVNQADVWVATAVMMVLRDANVGPRPTTGKSAQESLKGQDMVSWPWKNLCSTGMPKTSM